MALMSIPLAENENQFVDRDRFRGDSRWWARDRGRMVMRTETKATAAGYKLSSTLKSIPMTGNEN